MFEEQGARSMADIFSTMVAHECIQCSMEDFQGFNRELLVERKRLSEEGLDFNVRAEFCEEDGMFIFAEDYFGDDDLTEALCLAVGRLLSSVGRKFLDFGFSQTSYGVYPRSHEGGRFRIYNDGQLVWPKVAWPRSERK